DVLILSPAIVGDGDGAVNVHINLTGQDTADSDGKRRLLQAQDNPVSPPGSFLFTQAGEISGEFSGTLYGPLAVYDFDIGPEIILSLSGGIPNPFAPPPGLMLA